MKNGLRAAHDVIIPVDTGYFSLHGLTQQLTTIEMLSERYHRQPAVRLVIAPEERSNGVDRVDECHSHVRLAEVAPVDAVGTADRAALGPLTSEIRNVVARMPDRADSA